MRLPRVFWNVWVAAFLIRLAIAMIPGGNPYDQACFKAWGIDMLRHGPATFYAMSGATIPCDYPPLYLYLLGAWAWLAHLVDPQIVDLGREQIMGMSLLNAWFKLPAALADLLNGWLILRIAQPLVGDLKARAGAALYLFNPLFLYDSVYWGQMDGLLLTFMLLVVQLLRQEKLVLAALCGTLAVLLKPQGLFLLPFALMTRLSLRSAGRVVAAFFAAVLLAAMVVRPFWPAGSFLEPFLALIRLMQRTAGAYPFGAMKAFNLHALAGMNLPDSVLVFGVAQQVWGLILVGVVQVAIGLTLWRRRGPRSFFLGAALSVGAFFLLLTRMHERYFIPALGLMTLATILDPRLRRDYWALCSISILNLLYAQDPHIASFFDAKGIATLLSMANLGLFSRLLWQFITGPAERNEAGMAKEGQAACIS